MMPVEEQPIALIGAYERDNFGDLLLGLVTRDLLARPVRWTAPTAGRTDRLLGAHVVPYPDEFSHQSPAASWVVGGEVGGVSLRGMLRYNELDPAEVSPLIEHPYLPRPSRFKGTAERPFVVNSAGLSGVMRLKPKQIQQARAALREADAVSVRDPASSALLDEWGIEHRLAPDVVHALCRVRPLTAEKTDTVVVQVRAKDTSRATARELADLLTGIPRLNGLRIALFVAGTAPGHDSPEHYRELMAALATAGTRPAVLIDTREPFQLAEAIATSQLWIGTSLHGRIIAAQYGVPRISLNVPKVNRYAEHWDDAMPYGVPLTTLGPAVEQAFSGDPTKGSGTLTDLAVANLNALAHVLAAETPRALADRLDRRTAAVSSYQQERAAGRTPSPSRRGSLTRMLKAAWRALRR